MLCTHREVVDYHDMALGYQCKKNGVNLSGRLAVRKLCTLDVFVSALAAISCAICLERKF